MVPYRRLLLAFAEGPPDTPPPPPVETCTCNLVGNLDLPHGSNLDLPPGRNLDLPPSNNLDLPHYSVEFLSKQNDQFGLTGESGICSGCNLEHILNNIIEMFPANYSQNKCPVLKLQSK